MNLSWRPETNYFLFLFLLEDMYSNAAAVTALQSASKTAHSSAWVIKCVWLFVTFRADVLLIYTHTHTHPLPPPVKKISEVINSGFSFKLRATYTTAKHWFYMTETHPVIKNSLVFLKHWSVANLVSSTANMAQLKQITFLILFFFFFFFFLFFPSSSLWSSEPSMMKTRSFKNLHVYPSLEGYGLCSSWV